MNIRKKFKTCFIMPAFNEEKNISNIILGLKKFGEVIVVDDFSNDNTSLIAKNSGAIVVKHKKNFGYDHSIYSGFKKAHKLSYRYVVSIDSDGQHSVSDARRYSKFLNKGFDIVYGRRKNFQRISERLFSMYTKYFYKIEDPMCGLKGYNLVVCKKFGLLKKDNGIGSNILIEAKRRKIKTLEIKINQKKRLDKTRYGGFFIGNIKILRALSKLIFRDMVNFFIK
jgi:glycosyltransferase involved in cell wall biosynthesis